MNILKRLLKTSIATLQRLGFTNKTYSVFNEPPPVDIKRKGHCLHNPSDTQVKAAEMNVLTKARIERWLIEDNCASFDSQWDQRPENIIDTLVIGATDSASWNSSQYYSFCRGKKNNITPGKPLPGIGCHIFINASGIIEKTAEYTDVIYHTKGVNNRSIGIMIQYNVSNNSAPPIKKITAALERALALLCLEFKLNPYKAIKGQREISMKWFPGLKGCQSIQDISPGPLISLDEIRREVAIKVKRKLKYSASIKGQVTPKFDHDTIDALNKFNSKAIRNIYCTLGDNGVLRSYRTPHETE